MSFNSESRFTRRAAIASGAVLAGSALLGRTIEVADVGSATSTSQSFAPGEAGRDYNPVHTPNGETLAWKVVGGVKVFHLIAEEFEQEIAPGLRATLWGYNGRSPGPTIEAVDGDRVRFYVTNRLPEATTIHWHGILVPSGMDGVSGVNQDPIPPGETFKYEFTLRQHGTAMYHSHFDDMTQQALGTVGMFIIHPRNVPAEKRPDRDFVLMTHEMRIDAGVSRPTPLEMVDFNVLTFNGKAFPGTAPLVAKLGDRVRIRFGNLSPMSHHPIHLHGYHFKITQTNGGVIPESAQWPDSTVLVPVGSTRTIEFIADNPGDWSLHCHMSHHTMNQMGHAGPNIVGIDVKGLDERMEKVVPKYMTMAESGMGGMGAMEMPSPPNSIPMRGAPGPHGYIDMGGMFTLLKVRENVNGYDDPGWYKTPPGEIASRASAEELKRDGIAIDKK